MSWSPLDKASWLKTHLELRFPAAQWDVDVDTTAICGMEYRVSARIWLWQPLPLYDRAGNQVGYKGLCVGCMRSFNEHMLDHLLANNSNELDYIACQMAIEFGEALIKRQPSECSIGVSDG